MFNVGDRVRGAHHGAYGDAYSGVEGTVRSFSGSTVMYIDIVSSTKSRDSLFAKGRKNVGVFKKAFLLIEEAGPEPYESFFL